MKEDLDKIFRDMNTVFDDMNKVFSRMEKIMDETEVKMEAPISWEKWFAWHPVRDVHGKHHWLKKIYRKYSWVKSTEQPFGKGYDYGTIFDVLKEAGN